MLNFRTLRAVCAGGPSYWRLSDPLRWPLRIRGSMLAVMRPGYLRTRLDDVVHWCPFDSGGVRLGFHRLPAGLRIDDLMLTSESLAALLSDADATPSIDSAVTSGLPHWEAVRRALPGDPAVPPPGAPSHDSYEWTYEVLLADAAPPTPDEVLALYCPNTAVAEVLAILGRGFEKQIRVYNPRRNLDVLAMEPHPLRRRIRVRLGKVLAKPRLPDPRRA